MSLQHNLLEQSSFLSQDLLAQSRSQLLDSRLTQVDMEQMSKQTLLAKLLELYRTLTQTEKDNQLLRIQKAQLRNQFSIVKQQAISEINKCKVPIQEKNLKPNQIFPSQNQKNSLQTPAETIKQCYITPYETDSQTEQNENKTTNKVFIKSHKRGVSTNVLYSQPQYTQNKVKEYKSSINSPFRQQETKIQYEKSKKYNKIQFPQHKIKNLLKLEEQYQEKRQEEVSDENNLRTLDNFESFYCPQQAHSMQKTQRFVKNFVSPPKFQNFQKNKLMARIVSPKKHLSTKFTQEMSTNEQSSRTLGHSMSSSNFSGTSHSSSSKFKIPTSIQQIWNSSNVHNTKEGQNFYCGLKKKAYFDNGKYQKKSYLGNFKN